MGIRDASHSEKCQSLPKRLGIKTSLVAKRFNYRSVRAVESYVRTSSLQRCLGPVTTISLGDDRNKWGVHPAAHLVAVSLTPFFAKVVN